ncbi:MFS transporter [Bacillus horti]|uniref:PPP family 3-phenylpropionic acid transporter n=2 Tax=Caldalkalibacillus horti TaxID=77523 RepID=A0ABT9VWQ9_9BACI|nr:PPP family 3-phenylpropionic acid transporter [Bacillus horti]
MSAYFLFSFIGFGAFFPLLSLHLEESGLSGSQIGTIVSIGPVVAIIAQPMWGMISDRFQNPRLILTICALLTGGIGLGFLLADIAQVGMFFFFACLAAFLSVFHSAMVPLSDSIVLNYVKKKGGDYGFIRLWGAVGYALAVWLAGLLIEATFTAIIFYIFAAALFVSALFVRKMPTEADVPRADIRNGLKELFRIPPYVMFLASTFLVFGTINANNFYFGLYYTAIGGTVAGVGLVFLVAAGSEAPFMLFARKVMNRLGIYQVLMICGLLSSLRWILFYFEPNPGLILALSIIQGLAIGFYIPAAVQLVRELSPDDVKVTGMTIYASFGNGLGTMACTFVGGYVIDAFSITTMYGFFGIASLIGVGLAGISMLLFRRRSNETLTIAGRSK